MQTDREKLKQHLARSEDQKAKINATSWEVILCSVALDLKTVLQGSTASIFGRTMSTITQHLPWNWTWISAVKIGTLAIVLARLNICYFYSKHFYGSTQCSACWSLYQKPMTVASFPLQWRTPKTFIPLFSVTYRMTGGSPSFYSTGTGNILTWEWVAWAWNWPILCLLHSLGMSGATPLLPL